MAGARKTPAKATARPAPRSFRDKLYIRRRLNVAGETLVIEQAHVTVTDPDVANALAQRPDFAEVPK